MAIQHDSQGFLLGDPVDIGGALSALNDIRDDIHAIRSALSGAGLDAIGINIPRSKSRRFYDDSPSSVPTNTTITPNARRSSPLSAVSSSAIQRNNVVEPRRSPPAHAAANKRDEKGRFTGSVLRQSNDRVVESDSDAANATALRDAATKIADAVSSAGNGIEESDPAVKAMNEIAQPAARGYEMLFSGNNKEEKRKEGWFRKILNELKIFRKEESIFNKAANSSLKNLEDGQMAGDGGGGSSWLRRYILPLAIGFLGWLIAGSSKGLIQKFSEAHNRAMEAYVFAPIRKISDGLTALIDSVSSKIEGAWNAFTGFVKDKTGIDIQSSVNTVKEKVSDGVNAIKESRVGKAVSEETNKILDSLEEMKYSALETVMPKGYRHKARFYGIKGGDDLSENGTYTNAEAERIRHLKTSGANTSAHLSDGMSEEIMNKISEQAKKYGLDPAMMLKIAAMESGGNPNAISKNGAIGLYQFTGRTATGVGIKDRFNVDQNIDGAMKLTAQNISSLKRFGLPVTEENIYMMHQLGPRDAREIIRGAETGKTKSELSHEAQKAMDHNYGAKSSTAAEYINTNKIALDKRYAAIQNIPTASASIPSAPSLPQPIKLSEAPQIESLIGSAGAGRNQTTVQVAQQDVGQDVRDRGIAHIVTGGLSN